MDRQRSIVMGALGMSYKPKILATADGGTGSIGADYGWFKNISIIRATTTNAGDSVKITSADGTAFSASNYGEINLMSATTAGVTTSFTITADVTILLTGAHWQPSTGSGTASDLTGALLNILAINDNGSLKWGVASLSGRYTLLTTDTTATPGSITLQEHVLCNSAIGSASNTCKIIAFVRADYDDTGGAASKLWAIQTGIGDVVTGESADDLWQPFNMPPSLGYSGTPTWTNCFWKQNKREIVFRFSFTGTSNATTIQAPLPTKCIDSNNMHLTAGSCSDAGAQLSTVPIIRLTGDSSTADFYPNGLLSAWTASLVKAVRGGQVIYEVGPAASFIN